jgi:hypothetical protein
MPTGYPANGPQPYVYGPEERARDTDNFLTATGHKFYPVTVRILTLAENACVVADSGGVQRIIKWPDLSFASEYIARQNPGAIVDLKIKRWV